MNPFCRLLFIGFLALWTLHTAADAIEYDANSITLALTTEPPSLDSSLSEDSVSSLILSLTNEGLVSLDVKGNLVPGVAESWEIAGTSATFRLRDNARWSDGSVVTAHDFEYAFKRLFDPKTGASGSTFYGFIFLHAMDILAGERSPEELGVQAVDDFTLEISLTQPVPYLLEVLLGSAYYPLKQSFVESQQGEHGADAGKLLSNGPFVLSAWQHGASLKLDHNPHYWNKGTVNLNGIDVGYITSDVRALLNLFISDEIASLSLDDTTMKDANNAGLRIRQHRTSCINMLTLNLREGRATANRNLRKALQAVFNADVFVKRVIATPANRPTDSVFTSHLRGVKRRFTQEYPPPRVNLSDEKAREFMAKARDELEGQIPPLVLLAREGADKQVEYLQGLFAQKLGLDVKIDKQTFKQSIVKLIAGDFDIAQSGFCSGTLRDPAYVAGIFESGSTFNDGRFSNKEYDGLLAVSRSTMDPKIRMDAFGRMQEILFEEVAVLPTREPGIVYVQHDKLTDVLRYPVVSFARSRIVP